MLTAAEYIDGEFSDNSEIRAVAIENHGYLYTTYLNDGRIRYGTGIPALFHPPMLSPSTLPLILAGAIWSLAVILPHNGTDFVTYISITVVEPADVVVSQARRHLLAGNDIDFKHGRNCKARDLSQIMVNRCQAFSFG